MKKFVCKVCGYIYEGDAAPAECPVCHAKSNMFEEVKGELTLAAEHEYGIYAKTVKNNPDISEADKKYIFDQLKPTIPDLSLATVYRNLAMFKAEGTIDSVGVYNGLERFDFRTDPHAHFICRVCGAVSDINWLELPADTLQEVEQQTGASVETCRIAVSGVCAACMKKDTQ